jgi:arylsulfatase A-like enzyme
VTPEPAPRPNIVIINCDDLGYGDLPPYENTVMNTPHINQLAQGGQGGKRGLYRYLATRG